MIFLYLILKSMSPSSLFLSPGVEFAAELRDWIKDDLVKYYSKDIIDMSQITLVDGLNKILNTYSDEVRRQSSFFVYLFIYLSVFPLIYLFWHTYDLFHIFLTFLKSFSLIYFSIFFIKTFLLYWDSWVLEILHLKKSFSLLD